MARLFTAGAEEGGPRAFSDLMIQVTNRSNVRITDIGNPDYVIPRTGNYCYYIYGSDFIAFGLPSGLTEVYMGFALCSMNLVNGNWSDIMRFATSDFGLSLSTGTLQFRRGGTAVGTTATMPIGSWNYIEIYLKPADSNGRAVLKLNGVTVIDFTGDTNNAVADAGGTVKLQGLSWGTSNAVNYFDDIVVNDTSGATNNSWPGQVRLFPLNVRAVGDAQQMSRGGVDLGSNLSHIREAGSGISWIEDSVSGHRDLYYVDAPQLPVGAVVNQVIVDIHARALAGGQAIVPMIKAGSVESTGAAQTLGPSWQSVQRAWPINPATGSPWTQSDLATLQLGVGVV